MEFTENRTPVPRRGFVDEFKATIDSAARQLERISEEESVQPRTAGKWSPKEIVGHLVDSAANNHARFVQAQLTDSLSFPTYDQEAWVRIQRYDDEPWPRLVELWRLYNLHLAHLMAGVDELTLTRQRKEHNLNQIAWQAVDQDKPVTLEWFMRDYVNHLKNHLHQILAAN